MSTAAQKILTEAKALPPEEMRELLRDIELALEDIEDAEDAERVLGELARGETTTHSWDEVMKELGLRDADLVP